MGMWQNASMKIGCSVWCLGEGMGLDKKLRMIQKAGYCLVELSGLDDFLAGGDEDELRGLLRKHGLDVVSYHSDNFIDRPEVLDGTRPVIEKLQLEIGLTSRLGGKIVVVHSAEPDEIRDPKTCRAITEEVLRECLPAAREHHVVLALENLELLTRETIASMLEEFDDEWMKFMLDVTHIVRYARDEGGLENTFHCWVEQLGKYLCHIHASDANREHGHVPIGRGIINWQQLIANVDSVGFTGCWMVEARSEDLYGAIVKSRGYLLSLLDQEG